MKDIQFIIWLFPIIFMLHDFEEIVFVKPWFEKAKNRERLQRRFPKLSKRLLQHFDPISTSSFSLAVAEEFLLISAVTIAAYLAGWYYLWLGGFIAFTAHLFAHCIQGIAFRGYIPTLITSIICLPLCCYLIVSFCLLYEPAIDQAIIFSIIATVIMVVNLMAVHKVMYIFDKWLNAYQKDKR